MTVVEGQQTNSPRGNQQTRGVRLCFGNPEPFFAEGTALSEPAQLRMAGGEPGTGEHCGQED
jgi:hypothetical protein